MFKSSLKQPQIINPTSNMSLYKIVKKGGTISENSPFWLSKNEFIKILKSNEKIENLLALPEESCSKSYDIYKITLKRNKKLDNVLIFESIIAPTKQGRLKRAGGAIQTLVPDRQKWTTPIKINKYEL